MSDLLHHVQHQQGHNSTSLSNHSCVLVDCSMFDYIVGYLTWKERLSQISPSSRRIPLSPISFVNDHIHLSIDGLNALKCSDRLRALLICVTSLSFNVLDVPLAIDKFLALFPKLRSLVLQFDARVFIVDCSMLLRLQSIPGAIKFDINDYVDETARVPVVDHVTMIGQLFDSLPQCVGLETLIIRSIAPGTTWREAAAPIQCDSYKQLALLPRLTTMLISGLCLDMKSAEVLCSDLPQLTHLDLSGCVYEVKQPYRYRRRPVSSRLHTLSFPDEPTHVFEQDTPTRTSSLQYLSEFKITNGNDNKVKELFAHFGALDSLTSLQFSSYSLKGIVHEDGQLAFPNLRYFSGPYYNGYDDSNTRVAHEIGIMINAYQSQLRFLCTQLYNNGVTEKRVARSAFSCSQLRVLDLTRNWEDDASLYAEPVAPLLHLHTLTIRAVYYTHDSKYPKSDQLLQLLDACPNIEDLVLEVNLSIDILVDIGQFCPSLRRLSFTVSAYSNNVDEYMAVESESISFPRLEFCTVTNMDQWAQDVLEAVVHVLKDAPHLRLLRVAGWMDPSAFHVFGALTSLQSLQLDNLPAKFHPCSETPVAPFPLPLSLVSSGVNRFVARSLAMNELVLSSEEMWQDAQNQFAILQSDLAYSFFRKSVTSETLSTIHPPTDATACRAYSGMEAFVLMSLNHKVKPKAIRKRQTSRPTNNTSKKNRRGAK